MAGEAAGAYDVALLFATLIVLAFLASAIKIVKEYERAVIFRLGRIVGAKGPGLFFIVPFIDKMVKVDLRITVVDVPEQKIITKDNVTVGVDAVVYYKVMDPVSAVLKIENYNYAVLMLAQTTLRDVIGQVDLDDLLTNREKINIELQKILDELTDPWGIKVTQVTIKEVKLPESMLRAMAKQAEAERWRRAKIIEAEGERQAAAIMAEAADYYSKHPVALRLRELQTLFEIAKEKNLIVVTPQYISSLDALSASLGVMQRKGAMG
ncbi:MAG: slipin family protein [Desulfurococcales archaeon]|nr:slipin family protein [Desulfurococcales archaeon]